MKQNGSVVGGGIRQEAHGYGYSVDRAAFMGQAEAMWDMHGLGAIVMVLADIANEKAEHVRENWQDESLGKAWDKVARELLKDLTISDPLGR
jgi:hypothetical protein